MWIFTRYGFYSVANARLKNGRIARHKLMVRARQRRHLENLIARFPALAACEIAHSAETDYRYRIVISKSAWARVVSELAKEQCWSNFKEAAERFLGRPYDDYVRVLHRVWSELHNLQQNEPILLDREMLAGIRDFCLARLRQMEATTDYADRIALGRAFRTWQEHFGLPNGAADLAWRIADYWRVHPTEAAALTIPEQYTEFVKPEAGGKITGDGDQA